MDKENKRYVVQMEMYVYADNDYMARKRANDLRLSIDNRRHSQDVVVKEIGEQPFASFDYRKEQWKFTSARSGDEYIVRYNIRKELSCSCWGYIAHRKCKHIKEVMELVA